MYQFTDYRPFLEFFSDTFSEGNIGIEIKAWFPLATEITGRFKESQLHLKNKKIDVVIIAWIPDKFIAEVVFLV